MGIFGISFGSKEVVYFPGCFTSSFFHEKTENWKRILKKIGVNFSILKDIICCGGVLDEAGYEKNLRKLAKENLNTLKERGVKKIIVSCPLCLNTFRKYKELLPEFDIEIEFILETILKELRENPDLIRNRILEEIIYYDSCYLPRYSNIVEEPRELLRLLGYKIKELNNYGKDSICCGSCGDLPITNNELSNKIVLSFIKMLKRKNAKRIVTSDLRAFKHIKENLDFAGTKDIEIVDFSDIICRSLGIKSE